MIWPAVALWAALMHPPATMADVAPDDVTEFSAAEFARWERRSFQGQTHYERVDDEGRWVVRADARAQASVLYREQVVDLRDTPWLSWSWKVASALPGTQEQTRPGDDYAARVYVVAKTGRFPWQSVAVNYVWAGKAAVGEQWDNPFSSRSRMLALQSGNEQAGIWVHETRNVAEDLFAIFGRRFDRIVGYAIMTDADNTGGSATAWFGAPVFHAPATD